MTKMSHSIFNRAGKFVSTKLLVGSFAQLSTVLYEFKLFALRGLCKV